MEAANCGGAKLSQYEKFQMDMMDDETYLSVNGYSQPTNIGFYVKECLVPEMVSATPPWTTL